MASGNGKQSTRFSDSLLVGTLVAYGHDYEAIYDNETGRTDFLIYGDVGKTLSRIYANDTVPVLTLLEKIKQVRRELFNKKSGVQR